MQPPNEGFSSESNYHHYLLERPTLQLLIFVQRLSSRNLTLVSKPENKAPLIGEEAIW